MGGVIVGRGGDVEGGRGGSGYLHGGCMVASKRFAHTAHTAPHTPSPQLIPQMISQRHSFLRRASGSTLSSSLPTLISNCQKRLKRKLQPFIAPQCRQ